MPRQGERTGDRRFSHPTALGGRHAASAQQSELRGSRTDCREAVRQVNDWVAISPLSCTFAIRDDGLSAGATVPSSRCHLDGMQGVRPATGSSRRLRRRRRPRSASPLSPAAASGPLLVAGCMLDHHTPDGQDNHSRSRSPRPASPTSYFLPGKHDHEPGAASGRRMKHGSGPSRHSLACLSGRPTTNSRPTLGWWPDSCAQSCWMTDRTLPAGSVNQAIEWPWPR
jgi:hypothetical protein